MIDFSSDFICGNGKLVSYELTDCEERVKFLAEQKLNEAKPLWFYFQINGLRTKKVIFEIANGHQFLTDTNVNEFVEDAPVYQALNGEWKRTEKCSVQYSEDGMPKVTFTIDDCPENVRVAFCYPYGPENLAETMKTVEGFTEQIIGYSTKGRPILRYATDGGKPTGKPGVYFTCRQHAAEVGGAWVLDGIIRFFGSEAGRELREKLAIWIVPMVDVDGVVEGGYGKDQAIGDMNRAWTTMFQKRTEIDCVVQDMYRWKAACKPVVVCDMHSPSHEHLGMLINIHEVGDPTMKQFKEDLLQAINVELAGTDFEPFHANYVTPSVSGSSQGATNTQREFAENILSIPDIVFEMSYQGGFNGHILTKEEYHAYGAYVAKALARMLLG